MTVLSRTAVAPVDPLAAVCPGQAADLCSPRPWAREADMLPGVIAHRNVLAPGTTWRAFYEVPGPRGGIVDLVWVRFSRAALANRPATAGALDMTAIRTLQALGAGVPSAHLSAYAGVSRGHLTRAVFPRLHEAGWVERVGRSWVGARHYRSVVTAVVTAELKRDDWRTALKQAARHRTAADASWVVLDAQRAGAATSARPSFAHAGVGLAGLALRCNACIGASPQLEVIHPAGTNSSIDVAGRAFFGEQCLQLALQGTTSGPERPVFGRFL